MSDFAVEGFITSYIDSIQLLPLEMQGIITDYLQSDLQQRNLLALSKQLAERLRETACVKEKKKILRKFIVFLVAIQDICSRRMNDLDELLELIETHSQKLIDSRLKINSNETQFNCPGTESIYGEIESSNHEICNQQSNEKLALLRRNSVHRLESNKLVGGLNGPVSMESTLRRRQRLPLRRVNTNMRANSQRALGKWASGIHRRKTANSTCPVVTSTSNAVRPRSIGEHKHSGRAILDQRALKFGTTYTRYSRVQQQRFRSRVLSRPVSSGRARGLHYPELSSIRGSARKKVSGSYQMNQSYVGCKGSRSSLTGKRYPCRQEYGQPDYYLFDDKFQSSIESGNKAMDNNVDKLDEDDIYNLRGVGSPKDVDHDQSKWNTNDSENEASDCTSESKGTSEGSNDHVHTFRASPANTDHGHQRTYRLRKSGGNTMPHDRIVCRRTSTGLSPTPPSDSSQLDNRFLLSSGQYSNKLSKRGSRGIGTMRMRLDTQGNARISSENPLKYGDEPSRHKNLMQIRNLGNNRHTSEPPSDASASPDERLYCICKKVSFGEMIACDNKFCEVEWFHFSCVDIRVQPKGKWYCPYCRGDSSKTKRADL